MDRGGFADACEMMRPRRPEQASPQRDTLLALLRQPPSGRLAFAVVATVSIIFALAYLPLLQTEEGRDWTTYARSAYDWTHGFDLYYDHGRLINLYPPAMAVLWSWGVTPQLWLLLSVLALLGVATLARGWASLGLCLLTLLQLPVFYDLMTGNVTSLYVGAIAIRMASRRWAAGVPLGVILAIAPKPALAPFVFLLLVKNSRQTLVPIVVALAITAATLVGVGPAAFVEYLAALLDSQRQLAGWTGGNLGLARAGLPVVIGGLVVATVAVITAARFLTPDRAVALGLGAGPLVQPTIGYYYAALAIPGLILLWRRSPWTATAAALTAIVVAVITPALSGLVLAAAAVVSQLQEQQRVSERGR